MSTVSVRSRMIHRCTLQRDDAGIDNDIGAKQVPSWDDNVEAQVCFFYTTQGREIIQDRGAVFSALRMLLPLGTDVNEKDRVLNITDREGNHLFTGALQIRSILPHHTHLEVDLVRPS